MRKLSPKLKKPGRSGFSIVWTCNDIMDRVKREKDQSNRESMEQLSVMRNSYIQEQGIVPGSCVRHIDSGQEYEVKSINERTIVVRDPKTGKDIKYAPEVFVRVPDEEVA